MNRLFYPVRWLLDGQGIPLMSRPTFRLEMINAVFLGLAAGVMGPDFAQLFVRKSLQTASMVPVIAATFAMGNLFGVFIGPYLQRRRRIRYGVMARLVIAAAMASVALLPAEAGRVVPFVALLAVPFLLNAVILNVRSGLWHSNYPTRVRGQIFSKRFIIVTAATAASAALAGRALDAWPWAHRLVYPLGAACAIASAAVYSRIRVRREASMRRANRNESFHLLEGFRLLGRDPDYARFMAWQMLSGCAVLINFSTITLMLIDVFGVSYKDGTNAMTVVPLLVALGVAPMFGRLFDTISITRFRAAGAALWASSRAVLFAAFLTRSWACVLAAAAIQGIARATGGLAFTIGHTHFAPPHRSQVYMGIHMTLQGFRGMTMPFVGVWLYHLPGVGINVLWIGAALQFVAAAGFAMSPAPKKLRQKHP